MPAITSDNKNYFKLYLKRWRDKFTSPLQLVNLSDIENVFNSVSDSLTIGTQTVKVGLFGGNIGDEALDISSLSNNELLYLPGTGTDYVNLKTNNTDNYSTLYFSNGGSAFEFRNGTVYNELSLNETVIIGSKKITVKAIGGLLLSVEDGPTYSITHNANSHEILPDNYYITEGDSMSFTITTTNFGTNGNGTLYWSLEGSIDANDFTTISGSVVVSNNSVTIPIESVFDISNTEQDYFKLCVKNGSTTGTIVASSDYISLRDKIVTCSIAESETTIAEGSSVTYTVTTSGLDDGTVLIYQSSNTTDVAPSNGTITINNNTATFTVAASEDVFVENDETFTIDIKYSNNVLTTSNAVTIQNTTSYSFTTSASTVNENDEVTFTINTTGIPDGTSLYYIASLNSIDVTPHNTNFVINSNTASITIKALQDLRVDTGDILTLDIKSGGTTVATTSAVSIIDTPFTITVTPDQPFNIDESIEGSSSDVTFTITTTGVGDGTVLTVQPSTGNNLDISLSSSSLTINNNTATVTANIVRDARTEGSETMNLRFRNTSGETIITSPDITVTDTSFVGSRQDNKTFGPITVVRDNGIESSAEDYYTICGLDNIPDGGKISIFVDNSGSMTTGTIRASINKLLLKLQERNISIVVVENPSENWISSFDTPL